MNVAGYLVMMSNLQALSAAGGGQTKDMSIRVGPLQELTNELSRFPDFSIECFKSNGFCKIGNIGKYISENLQKYLCKRTGDPNDQGLVLTLYFADPSELQIDEVPNDFMPVLPTNKQYPQNQQYSQDKQHSQDQQNPLHQQYAPYALHV